MKYFDPTGEELSQEEFIKFYSKCYYMANSKDVEDAIEEHLKEDQLSANSIFDILAWKIGKISHKNSFKGDKGDLVFHEGWNKERLETNVYGKKLNLQAIAEKIEERDLKESDLNDYLDAFHDFEGLGPVYIITLRFFATKGKTPIYDRFAYKALKAIINEKSPRSINEINLTFKNAVKTYDEYCNQLKAVFGDRWNERSVDQALWAYGHMLCSFEKT